MYASTVYKGSSKLKKVMILNELLNHSTHDYTNENTKSYVKISWYFWIIK